MPDNLAKVLASVKPWFEEKEMYWAAETIYGFTKIYVYKHGVGEIGGIAVPTPIACASEELLARYIGDELLKIYLNSIEEG